MIKKFRMVLVGHAAAFFVIAATGLFWFKTSGQELGSYQQTYAWGEGKFLQLNSVEMRFLNSAGETELTVPKCWIGLVKKFCVLSIGERKFILLHVLDKSRLYSSKGDVRLEVYEYRSEGVFSKVLSFHDFRGFSVTAENQVVLIMYSDLDLSEDAPTFELGKFDIDLSDGFQLRQIAKSPAFGGGRFLFPKNPDCAVVVSCGSDAEILGVVNYSADKFTGIDRRSYGIKSGVESDSEYFESQALAIDVSPDGTMLAVCEIYNGFVKESVLNLSTRKNIHKRIIESKSSSSLASVAFDRDNDVFFAYDGKIIRLSSKSLKLSSFMPDTSQSSCLLIRGLGDQDTFRLYALVESDKSSFIVPLSEHNSSLKE